MSVITLDKFKKEFPHCKEPESWFETLMVELPKHGITSDKAIACFMAQCGHESGGWSKFSENLNYSSDALKKIFGKYFKTVKAEDYHRQPEKIANRIYANRMGNGDEASGEGWKYRGRGPIQLTGKSNYQSFSKDTGIDIVTNPDEILNDKTLLLQTAIWYWNSRNLTPIADKGDMVTTTKKINGGTLGLDERTKHFKHLIG